MKARIKSMILKLSGMVAGLAMLVAIGNANSTCLFVSYQPDVPEELK